MNTLRHTWTPKTSRAWAKLRSVLTLFQTAVICAFCLGAIGGIWLETHFQKKKIRALEEIIEADRRIEKMMRRTALEEAKLRTGFERSIALHEKLIAEMNARDLAALELIKSLKSTVSLQEELITILDRRIRNFEEPYHDPEPEPE